MKRLSLSALMIFILLAGLASSHESNYAIAVGEKDKERIIVLNEIYNPFSKDFLSSLHLDPDSKVLEVGCGIGMMSQEIANMLSSNGHVLATDLSTEQLNLAKELNKKHKNLSFKKLSAYNLSSLQENFDVVYVRFLLCHLPDPEAVLQQIKYILKPGGIVIIEDLTGNETLLSTPLVEGMRVLRHFDDLQFQVQQSDDHYFDKLDALLKKVGFTVNTCKRCHPKLDTLRKRTMLTYNLSSLKDTLINAGKLTEKEYHSMYPAVEKLAKNTEIEVYSYAFGQICATVNKEKTVPIKTQIN